MADGWSRWSIRRGNPVAAGHRQVQLNDESYLEDAVQTIRRELQVLVGRMEEDVLATFRERDHVLLFRRVSFDGALRIGRSGRRRASVQRLLPDGAMLVEACG